MSDGTEPFKRVTGLGGVFFKSANPKELKNWYERHLGIAPDEHGAAGFSWREQDDPSKAGFTVWEAFPQDTKYFQPSAAPFMLNYRVHDLHALLAALRAEGVTVDENQQDTEYGKFGWIMDPEGNRIELWEPPANV